MQNRATGVDHEQEMGDASGLRAKQKPLLSPGSDFVGCGLDFDLDFDPVSHILVCEHVAEAALVQTNLSTVPRVASYPAATS